MLTFLELDPDITLFITDSPSQTRQNKTTSICNGCGGKKKERVRCPRNQFMFRGTRYDPKELFAFKI